MKGYRKQLISWMFVMSQNIFPKLFKNHEPWRIYRAELLTSPENTIGKYLGLFLEKYGLELISKVERHPYHTITRYGPKVEDEIALHYLCLSNGKRSLYMYGAILLAILPEYYNYYLRSFRLGKQGNPFHHYDYKKLLNVPIDDFRQAIFSTREFKLVNRPLI